MTNYDTTQKRRQRRRRDALNEIAQAAGWASWSAYETAIKNEEVAIVENLFEMARQRVSKSQKLDRHADFIMADWHEGDEHWQWVLEADEDEIIDWAQSSQK